MRKVGPEASRSHSFRLASGFYKRYMSGRGLDIGYRGAEPDSVPILSSATGIEMDYPGYDGKTLPFQDESQSYVFTSHSLEHIADYKAAIVEWFRVLKVGGHLILIVPHQFLYEKKENLPSNWNGDHKRFYTPASLLAEIEASLKPNTYRVRHLKDNDKDFNYSIPPSSHSDGAYEIELVIQKIVPPSWDLA